MNASSEGTIAESTGSTVVFIAMGIFITVMAASIASAVPAFPGAQGFGARTAGGRGGRVIEVTTLATAGPGSFLEAIRAEGPRIVVFGVAGTIDLQGNQSIRNPYITIAGQSAPGDGICLKNGTLRVNTHDVIIRHLRVRPGDGATGGNPENRDCIDVAGDAEKVHDVIVDHCSFSWGIDENVATWYGPKRVTFQWCITSESLNDSLHPKGPHGKGMILGSRENTVTVHHCLFAHNADRHPLAGDTGNGELQPSVFDFRNNVLYNYGGPAGRYRGALRVNHIGNVLLPGPAGHGRTRGIYFSKNADEEFYLQGNVWPGRTGADPETHIMHNTVGKGERPPEGMIADQPFDTPGVRTDNADEALKAVLNYAGATRPVRDVVDARIVGELRKHSGWIIGSQKEVGGWPEYAEGKAPADSDDDAMPDRWEQQYGLDPDSADDAADLDDDGYTNIEEYLNGTHPAEQNNGQPRAQEEPQLQEGNADLRDGRARRRLQPPEYDAAAREAFVREVRKADENVASHPGLTMVPIEAGEFTRNGIVARITKPFEIASCEVTQKQWEAVMGTSPWEDKPFARDDENAPATYVSWYGAREFAARLTACGDAEYRLPTEAQWELACRAGSERSSGLWFSRDEIATYAWFLGNTVGSKQPYPHAVVTKQPNGFGLYDMAGNVLEWCRDKYYYWYWRPERSEPVKVDPAGPRRDTKYRVVRGGSFYYRPRQLLKYPRRQHKATWANFDTGFRVIRVVHGEHTDGNK